VEECRLNSSDSLQGQVNGSCAHNNELGFIKYGEFHD